MNYKIKLPSSTEQAAKSAVLWRAFAREGAKLFLTGRRLAPVEAVAKDIESAGGFAEAAIVDALNEQEIDQHLQSVVAKSGRIDISFNAMGNSPAKYLGGSLVDMDLQLFSMPLATYATSYFLTARHAARHMLPNKSGVIMTVTPPPEKSVLQMEVTDPRRLRRNR